MLAIIIFNYCLSPGCYNKYHRLGEINNRNLHVIIWEAGGVRSGCQHCPALVRAVSLAYRWPPPCRMLTWERESLTFLSLRLGTDLPSVWKHFPALSTSIHPSEPSSVTALQKSSSMSPGCVMSPLYSWLYLSDSTEHVARIIHSSVSPARLETPRVPFIFVSLASTSRTWHIIASQWKCMESESFCGQGAIFVLWASIHETRWHSVKHGMPYMLQLVPFFPFSLHAEGQALLVYLWPLSFFKYCQEFTGWSDFSLKLNSPWTLWAIDPFIVSIPARSPGIFVFFFCKPY